LTRFEWAHHLASYWGLRDRTNVLFLTYEETKRDTRATVAKVAKFMGVDLSDVEFASVERAET
jgi:hypothetical protein